VFAAAFTPHVTALDINPAAVRSARLNALLNQVEDRVQVHEGDLFAPVAGPQFDVILFNPPYFRGQPKDMLDQAFRSNNVVERFAAALPHHLTPTGHLLLLLSTTTDETYFLRLFHKQGYHTTIAHQRETAGERMTVYLIARENS
jgi:methylase of polypeptide subunit release factors